MGNRQDPSVSPLLGTTERDDGISQTVFICELVISVQIHTKVKASSINPNSTTRNKKCNNHIYLYMFLHFRNTSFQNWTCSTFAVVLCSRSFDWTAGARYINMKRRVYVSSDRTGRNIRFMIRISWARTVNLVIAETQYKEIASDKLSKQIESSSIGAY